MSVVEQEEPTPPPNVPLHRRLPGGRTLRDGRHLYWWGELLAVAIQHEMDHLEGKLFIDRLSPLKKEMAQKKLLKERAEREGHDLLDPRIAKKRGL